MLYVHYTHVCIAVTPSCQFPNYSRRSINIGWLTEWMKFLDVAKQTLSFTFCGFYSFWLILLHPFFFLFGL